MIILAGRYAGKKAIVVKSYDEGTKEHAFPHALVAGIEKAPQPVTKSMCKKKVIKRSKVKPFIKFINYQHIMPTRYSVNDIDVKSLVLASSLKAADKKKETKKDLKKAFETKYGSFMVYLLEYNQNASFDHSGYEIYCYLLFYSNRYCWI